MLAGSSWLALLPLVVLLHRKDLLGSDTGVLLHSSEGVPFVGESFDLLLLSRGNRAEVVDALVRQKGVGVLL